MNYEQAKKILKEHGQEHLLDYYDELDAPKKKMLLDDWMENGGYEKYLSETGRDK